VLLGGPAHNKWLEAVTPLQPTVVIPVHGEAYRYVQRVAYPDGDNAVAVAQKQCGCGLPTVVYLWEATPSVHSF
jgi:hypothetical protein